MHNKNKARRAIQFKEMQQLLDVAKDKRQTVNISAWEGGSGDIIEYRGWFVSSSNWHKGWHKLVSPDGRQIRTVPDIFIFKINDHPVYL